jgi:hypothetical protein
VVEFELFQIQVLLIKGSILTSPSGIPNLVILTLYCGLPEALLHAGGAAVTSGLTVRLAAELEVLYGLVTIMDHGLFLRRGLLMGVEGVLRVQEQQVVVNENSSLDPLGSFKWLITIHRRRNWMNKRQMSLIGGKTS